MANAISGNAGVAGASVALTGAATASTTSAADGSYSFAGLAAGAYVVTPTLASTVFTPTHLNETIIASDITNANFVAMHTPIAFVPLASDNFTRANEQPLNPANWTTVSGVPTLAVLSDFCVSDSGGFGAELFTPISFPNNQFCSATVHTFGLASQIILTVRADVTLGVSGYEGSLVANGDGTATFFIQRIDNSALIGVPYIVPIVIPGDIITLGVYGSLIFLEYNGTEVSSGTDTAFSSGDIALEMIFTAAQADTSVSLFSAGAESFSISGSCGASGAGATVTLSGDASGSTTAAAITGNYSFTGLVPGTYFITPSPASGRAFSPPNRRVVLVNTDITGVNFIEYTPSKVESNSANVSSPGQNFATLIQSPRTSVMGTNLRTKIIG